MAGLILAMVVLVGLAWILKHSSRRLKLKIGGPDCHSFPIIGQSYLLMMDPMAKISELGIRYGPIYQFDIGPLPTVVVCSKELVQEVLKHPQLQSRPYNALPTFEVIMKGLGIDGALLGFAGSEGRNWKEQRRFFQAHLRQGFLSTTEEIVQDEAQALVERLRERLDQGTTTHNRANKAQGVVQMHHFFMGGTVNVIWQICCGQRLDYDDPLILDVILKIYEFFKFLKPGPNSFLQLSCPTVVKLAHQLGFSTVITTYGSLVSLFEDEISNPEAESHGFISQYFEKMNMAVEERFSSFHGEMGRKNLVATLADVFMGGADTTNNQLEWIFLHLAHLKVLQDKLREDILDKVGRKIPKQEDILLVPGVESFLMEVLRFNPIAPYALPRLSTRACTIGGHHIPKHTQVLVDLNGCLRDPAIFEEPDKFIPDRFISENGDIWGREWISRNFGGGSRRCPGVRLAEAELFIFLVVMLQNFRFSLAEENPEPIFKGIYGLNHVPLPYQLNVTSLH